MGSIKRGFQWEVNDLKPFVPRRERSNPIWGLAIVSDGHLYAGRC